MPLVPLGLGQDLLQRVKKRVERELAPLKEQVQPYVDRAKEELGFKPRKLPPPGSVHDIMVRAREACRQDPPRLIHALYQAKDANVPTWRHLACYSVRDRGTNGGTLLFAACEKEGWKIECFDPNRFKDFQVTEKPWPSPAHHPYRIEFRDGD